MRRREMLSLARRDGKEAAENAASWCVDGNTSDAARGEILRGIRECDPAVLDRFSLPNLSGEYADAMTPAKLAELCEYDLDKRGPDDFDEICDAWEAAVNDAFWPALERAADRRKK